MKHFVIVLLAALAIVACWMFYRGSDSAGPSRQRSRVLAPPTGKKASKRPKISSEGGRTHTTQTKDGEVEVFLHDGAVRKQEEAAQKYLSSPEWTDLVKDSDYVPLEEAWVMDFTGVDFDADVLIAVETESGLNVEVTQEEWRRYVSLVRGAPMILAKLFHSRAAEVAKEYGIPFGLTDEQWQFYMEEDAEARSMSAEEWDASVRGAYLLDLEGARRTRRNAVEAVTAYYPPVENVEELPSLLKRGIKDQGDRKIAMKLVGLVAKMRSDLEDPEADVPDTVGDLAAAHNFTDLFFTRSLPYFEISKTWSFLDGGMPENAVAACSLGPDPGNTLTPPWLLPGEIDFVYVEDVWPHIVPPSFPERLELIRELFWWEVLTAELDNQGGGGTPEDFWHLHAEQQGRKIGIPIDFDRITMAIGGFRSHQHYRGFSSVAWRFATMQEEGWGSDEALREHYSRNRVFAENWMPAMEMIIVPAFHFDEDGVHVDWDRSLAEAEDARAQILSGEVDFSTMRARLHRKFVKEIADAGYAASAEMIDYYMGPGVMAVRMPQAGMGLGENSFRNLVDCTSIIRNAVCRLDRGEASPVWRTSGTYIVLRLVTVRAAELEGEFEDFRKFAVDDYHKTQFSAWANGVLTGLRLVN